MRLAEAKAAAGEAIDGGRAERRALEKELATKHAEELAEAAKAHGLARAECAAPSPPRRTAPHRTAPHRTAPRRAVPHPRHTRLSPALPGRLASLAPPWPARQPAPPPRHRTPARLFTARLFTARVRRWEATFEAEVGRRVESEKRTLEAAAAAQRTEQIRVVVDKLGVEMASKARGPTACAVRGHA